MKAEELARVRDLMAKAQEATRRRMALLAAAADIGSDHWPVAMVLVGLTLRPDFEELFADCNRLADADFRRRMAEVAA